ncbi:MAG: hypothetical protein M3459_06200 [Actinomycetota bacterium]|nr:hypothetical protein [Actinomycetota bacterium]
MRGRPDEAWFADDAKRNATADEARTAAEHARPAEDRAADALVLTEFVGEVAEAGRRARAETS